MPESGQVIGGRYRLDKIIGHGAFATVWAATNTYLDRVVAVKVLGRSAAKNPATVARFMNEAKFCATPVHPTIVAVEDVGQTSDGAPYLVMELLEGHTLDQILRSKGSLPWTMALGIIRHVMDGLAAAHERGILHRDVKPANIFLVKSRFTGPPVRVLDLGLARDVADDKRLTRTGQVVGTANYLPPETLLDEQPKGGTMAGDVFAAGMVLFVMLTGRFPFITVAGAADPAAEVYARAKFYKSRKPLPGPLQYDDSLPPALDAFVRRALDVVPTQRYADATEMRSALKAITNQLLPKTPQQSLVQNLEATTLGLPAFLADDGVLQPAKEADLGNLWESLGELHSPAQPEVFPDTPDGGLPTEPAGPRPAAYPTAPPPAPAGGTPQRTSQPSRESAPGEAPRSSRPSQTRTLIGVPARDSRPPEPGAAAGGSPRVTPTALDVPQDARASRPSTTPVGWPAMSQAGWLRRSRLGLMLVGAAGGSLLAAALLIGGFLVWRFVADDEVLPDGGPPAVPTPVVPRQNQLVEIGLQGLPDGSTLRLDGQPVSGPAIQKPVGSSAILEVVAPGYQPLHINLTFQANSVIDLANSLQRLPTADAGPPRQGAVGAPAAAHRGARRPQQHKTRHRDGGLSSSKARSRAKLPALPPAEIANPWGQ